MTHPALVRALLLLTAATGLPACATLQRFGARDLVAVETDVVYVPGSAHPKHRLDVFLPRDRRGFPVVHFVHGGYWHEGDRNFFAFFTGLYGSIGVALAQQGIGTVVQSYRLSPEVTIAGQVEDVARAVRWTADHLPEFGAAPDQLFLAGHSAGGHLVTWLAADDAPLRAAGIDPARIRGYVALSPVLDLVHMRAHQDADFNADVTDRVFGTDPGALAAWSPANRGRAGLPPCRVLLGERDYPYLIQQVRATVPRLQAAGWPIDLVIVPGYTHEDMVLEIGDGDDRVTPLVLAFVREQVGR